MRVTRVSTEQPERQWVLNGGVVERIGRIFNRSSLLSMGELVAPVAGDFAPVLGLD